MKTLMYREDDMPEEIKNAPGIWWLHCKNNKTGYEDWVFIPFTGKPKLVYKTDWKCERCGYEWYQNQIENDLCPKCMLKPLKKSNSDIRPIGPAYFNNWINYSNEECELFKKPKQFKHFKKRIELLLKRAEENRLIFLPKGDGILFKALKLYILNLIPTKNKDLTKQIYTYLYETFGIKKLKEIVKEYANYITKVILIE